MDIKNALNKKIEGHKANNFSIPHSILNLSLVVLISILFGMKTAREALQNISCLSDAESKMKEVLKLTKHHQQP